MRETAAPPAISATPSMPAGIAATRAVLDDAALRRSGPAAAVLLAAGISCFVLGALSVAAAASASVADALTLSERVGEVSGLSIATTVAFFASWAVLGLAWRRADPQLARVAGVAGALVAFGLLGTFPPVFNSF